MKKALFSLLTAVCLLLGVAIGASAEPVGVAAVPLQCHAGQDCGMAVSSHVAMRVMPLPSLDAKRSPLLRSDMRIASAGLVFNRTVDEILAESKAPS